MSLELVLQRPRWNIFTVRLYRNSTNKTNKDELPAKIQNFFRVLTKVCRIVWPKKRRKKSTPIRLSCIFWTLRDHFDTSSPLSTRFRRLLHRNERFSHVVSLLPRTSGRDPCFLGFESASRHVKILETMLVTSGTAALPLVLSTLTSWRELAN